VLLSVWIEFSSSRVVVEELTETAKKLWFSPETSLRYDIDAWHTVKYGQYIYILLMSLYIHTHAKSLLPALFG
jgi:hypothetical protein